MATKILMVCLGNICRSPLAEGILKSKLPKDQFVVDSAGTGDWHVGQLPDKRSIAIAKKYGIDITDQRAQHFAVKHFEQFDYIYAMDMSNYKNILQLAPNTEAKAKVKLILNELFPNENVEVPDPYYGGEEGFENVYQMLDKVCDVIAKKIK
ncbi:MAG: protein-tyrosine-phosphatase [Flavobacterium sp.]|uniref:low molecular weight protein-tyrosine-phosphatase n=1 Tax=Flavobacterium sp. TaxID=239 RepID=UPI000C3976F7|nr:low molecular weight protein-tyrosine-phosphatase [Flavobacterium sp.]MBF02941.1 protein-tyrosine-phosphatase [Flavobacterium sp.]|tara:strand:+ start:137 stop:592 length:456 start_codon:yes stop_codon:yes gene_type:complete